MNHKFLYGGLAALAFVAGMPPILGLLFIKVAAFMIVYGILCWVAVPIFALQAWRNWR